MGISNNKRETLLHKNMSQICILMKIVFVEYELSSQIHTLDQWNGQKFASDFPFKQGITNFIITTKLQVKIGSR